MPSEGFGWTLKVEIGKEIGRDSGKKGLFSTERVKGKNR
jgi:hypothetical protein